MRKQIFSTVCMFRYPLGFFHNVPLLAGYINNLQGIEEISEDYDPNLHKRRTTYIYRGVFLEYNHTGAHVRIDVVGSKNKIERLEKIILEQAKRELNQARRERLRELG